MFRLVSLHPGADATPAVAASLAGIGRDRAGGLLRELARAHLLTEHAPGRYAFHDLLRAYAADLSRAHDPEADRRQALTRLFDHYLHTCHAAALLLNPGWLPLELADPAPDTAPEQLAGPEHAASWYRAELATLVAVIAHAAENRFHTHAWQTCWGLAGYLEAQGRRRDLLAVCTTALSAAEHGGDLAGQAFAHRRLGLIQQADDACADADVHFRYALELYDRLGDRLRKGNTHISVAKMHEGQHRFPDALAHVRQAIECFRASGYIGGQAQALNSAGWYAAELGMHDQALRDCGQALELVRTAGNRKGEAHVLDSLGHIHRKSGDYPTALDYYCQALEIHRKLGNRYFCAQVLSRIGDTHHCSDTPQASHDAWRQALAILDELEHPDARALRTKLTYAETDST
jgi:tetratricopeptide (TPR) repeat protein